MTIGTAGEQPAVPSRPIGIVGAGVMGTGLAQALAVAGCQVIMMDIDPEALAAARASIRANLRAAALAGSGGAERIDDVLGRIRATADLADLGGAGFVIENAVERWPVKQAIYPELDRICPPDVVFAANTSTFPIADFAALTTRPDKVLGMHFMNPAQTRKMVEVIRARSTSEETLARAYALLAAMDREGVTVNDSPGFVSNRVLMLTVNEAIRVVEEGTADARDVDRIFCGCFGHVMGPLATADLIGLDTILLSLESLGAQYRDEKFAPASLLRELVANGRLGRKTGSGFFTY
jgi:3-hydroxybutyryl-CoA dehydrogenase